MPPNLNWKKKSYQYETNFSEGSLIKKKEGICLLCFAFFKDKISFFFVKKKKKETQQLIRAF